MTTSRSDPYGAHGLAVYFARVMIGIVAVFSTRGPLKRVLPASNNFTDCLVIGFAAVAVVVSMLVNYLPSTGWMSLIAWIFAWRIYDITCNHIYITVVDRSERTDPGYRSAVRAFVLSGLNLVELLCASFITERYLLASGFTTCLFDASVNGFEHYNARSAFLEGLYRATSLSSLDSKCAAHSGVTFAFAAAFTVAISTLILVVIARAVATMPFQDRSKAAAASALREAGEDEILRPKQAPRSPAAKSRGKGS